MKREAIKPAKLADAVAGHMESLILEGTLRPGEKLLPERELADRFEVSRPSLREALQKLEEKGLLQTGREGTVVSPRLASSVVDPLTRLLAEHPEAAFDYLEFRGGVEGMAAYYAAQRATEADREALSQIWERMEAGHLKDDPSEEADTDTDLHLAVYEAAHNVVLLHMMRGLSDMLRQDVFYARSQLYGRRGAREMLLEQHRAIYAAVMAGDADAARQAAEAHILFTSQTLKEIAAAEARLEVSLRRLGRSDLVASHGRKKG